MSPEVLKVSALSAHALWASTYDLNASPILRLEERIVEDLLFSAGDDTWGRAPDGWAPRQVSILDAGCGTGRWLAKLAQPDVAGVGIDLSAPMLRQAQRRPGLSERLVQADCSNIPLRSAAIDLAISSFCVAYMPVVRPFAQELARVVRPGGHLILSDFHPSARVRGWTRSFRHEETIVEILSFEHPLDRICDVFEQEGFELERLAEPQFSECDRQAFQQAGREDLFRKVFGEIAIFVCAFRRKAHEMVRDL